MFGSKPYRVLFEIDVATTGSGAIQVSFLFGASTKMERNLLGKRHGVP